MSDRSEFVIAIDFNGTRRHMWVDAIPPSVRVPVLCHTGGFGQVEMFPTGQSDEFGFPIYGERRSEFDEVWHQRRLEMAASLQRFRCLMRRIKEAD